jgi:hypothetical protein
MPKSRGMMQAGATCLHELVDFVQHKTYEYNRLESALNGHWYALPSHLPLEKEDIQATMNCLQTSCAQFSDIFGYLVDAGGKTLLMVADKVYMCIYIYVNVHVYMCIYICMYIYTYTYVR